MNAITTGLREFIGDVYGVEVDSALDFNSFSFEFESFKITDEEMNITKAYLNSIGENCDDATIVEIINNAKNRRYEDTYIENYTAEYLGELESQIEKDFKNIISFFEDELKDNRIKADEDSLTIKIDWNKDTITFMGKLTILDVVIVEAINGYGMFCYSLKDFKEQGNIKERILGHIHWLKEIESIYGTIYNMFRFNTKYIGDYCYGDSEITDEYLEFAYDTCA